jgi:hypothetical protein
LANNSAVSAAQKTCVSKIFEAKKKKNDKDNTLTVDGTTGLFGQLGGQLFVLTLMAG